MGMDKGKGYFYQDIRDEAKSNSYNFKKCFPEREVKHLTRRIANCDGSGN